eukprot:SAG22_NODE_3572_length_1636_cov_1.163956_1_plen_431_part_00
MSAKDLKTKEELRDYLATAELQDVLRNTLSGILKRTDLPTPESLVRTLGEELIQQAGGEVPEPAPADDAGDDQDDEEEARRMAAMRGKKRRAGVSAESTSTMGEAPKATAQKTEKTPEQCERIEKAISGNLLFDGVEGAQKEELFSLMFEKTIAVGDKIIVQGEPGDNFYIIDQGECDVYVEGPGKVASLSAGDSFGELALMYNAPRAATIEATAPSSLWAMDRMTFRSMLFEKANSKRETYKTFLGKVSLLEPLEPYEREKIADVLEEVSYTDDEEIIKEGDPGESLYILEEGSCVATKLIDGEQKVVKEYAVGDFFGELALLTDQPRAASVKAKGPVKCVMIGRKPFTRLVGQCDDILQRNQELYDSVNAKSECATVLPCPALPCPVHPLLWYLRRKYVSFSCIAEPQVSRPQWAATWARAQARSRVT